MTADKILLESMTFYGYHGVDPAEKELGQRFIVDVEITRDLRVPGESDDLADTINYAEVFRAVREVMEGPSRDLIESVAETIAGKLLDAFETPSVRVKVMKPEAPIKGAMMRHAAVEIVRTRESTP